MSDRMCNMETLIRDRAAIKTAVENALPRVLHQHREVLEKAVVAADEYHEDSFNIRLSGPFLTVEVVKLPKNRQECEERGYRFAGYMNAPEVAAEVHAMPPSTSLRNIIISRTTDMVIDDSNRIFYCHQHG